MESFQEKAGGEGQRRPSGHGKKYKGEGKEGEEVREENNGKKRNRQFRRNQDDKAKDSQKTGSQEEDKPLTFNAHALDLDPGIAIPERPSIDLTYTDFTRESYEMGTGRPFVPKKKKIVPFELSETPKMQADYWEGRAPGRRKLMNAMENSAEARSNGEGQPAQEKRQPDYKKENQEKAADKADKKDKQQKPQRDKAWPNAQNQDPKDRDRKRQEQKQQKAGGQQEGRPENRQESRQEGRKQENRQAGAGRGPEPQAKKSDAPNDLSKRTPKETPNESSRGVSWEAPKRPAKPVVEEAAKNAAGEETKAAPKEKKGGFFSRNKNRQNHNAGKQETKNKGEDQPQEQASQSLIRPYWLKK